MLRGGTVFDGVSPQRKRCDVRIVDGTIVEVDGDIDLDGCRVIDADGMWVVPGFVDAHSHADAGAVTGEGMEARALAGVTTEIVGQDGLGLAFATGSAWPVMAGMLPPIAGGLPGPEGYQDVAEYLTKVDGHAYARVATHVPHGTVRARVMGSELREPSRAEIEAMRALILRGVKQGAVGVSTGLSYAPALAADTAELVEVFRGLPRGTPYVSHLRSYGAGFDAAVDEAIVISRAANLSLHFSHLHISGPGRKGVVADYFSRLEGSGATWDTYPYASACTLLRSIIPAHAAALTATEMQASLERTEFREALAAEIDRVGPGETVAGGWETIYLVGLADSDVEKWDSCTVARIASESRISPGTAVVSALHATGGGASLIVNHGHMENVHALTGREGHLVGSDGIMGSGQPHPRVTHTFFRFLAWSRMRTIPVSPEEMIARMTARTAARFGLAVGAISVGRAADLLVLNPDELNVGPEFGKSRPSTVVHSFISGNPIVSDGRWRGDAQAGLALRANRTEAAGVA